MRFDYLSWEAFATLLTGALAVGAAILVGLRQTDIQTKQVLIQNRLADMEELKLREALFEARYQVYNASRRWLTATIMGGVPPYSFKDELPEGRQPLELKWADEFLDAVDRSAFLFRPSVGELLFEMWKAGEVLTRHKRMLADPGTASKKEREESVEKRAAALKYLTELVPKFSNQFGDELILTKPEKAKAQ
jgi:hypothetical protein